MDETGSVGRRSKLLHYEDIPDSSVLAPLRAKAANGDPVAIAVDAIAGRLTRLGATVNSLVDAEAQAKSQQDRFDGGLKVVLAILGVLGTAALGGVVWLVTTTMATSHDLPSLHSELERQRAEIEELRESVEATSRAAAETGATLHSIDARLGRIERRLDER